LVFLFYFLGMQFGHNHEPSSFLQKHSARSTTNAVSRYARWHFELSTFYSGRYDEIEKGKAFQFS